MGRLSGTEVDACHTAEYGKDAKHKSQKCNSLASSGSQKRPYRNESHNDCHKDGKMVFEKDIPQSVYPPNSAVPTSERTEPAFRREFVAVLADQIARYFYAHDPYADLGQDATALR